MFKVTSMSTYAHVLGARVLGGPVPLECRTQLNGIATSETETWPIKRAQGWLDIGQAITSHVTYIEM